MTAAERKEKAKAAEAEKKALRAELVKIATSITANPPKSWKQYAILCSLTQRGHIKP